MSKTNSILRVTKSNRGVKDAYSLHYKTKFQPNQFKTYQCYQNRQKYHA